MNSFFTLQLSNGARALDDVVSWLRMWGQKIRLQYAYIILTLLAKYAFLRHANGLLWTSQNIQRLEGSLLGDKALSWLYRFNKGIPLGIAFRLLLACGRPREGKEKVRIKQHPIIWMAAKTMKYLMHSKVCTQTSTNKSDYFNMFQGIAFRSSLYHFPWCGATWKTMISSQTKISASTFLPAQFNLFN